MTIKSVLVMPLRALVTVYRYAISPFFPGSCRFHPSCSAYAEEALGVHGPFYGLYLTLKRICRCHPWGGSGYDPVPDTDHACIDSREGSR